MAVDCGRALYTAQADIAQKLSKLTRAEILILDDILNVPEFFKFWNTLTVEDFDKILEILRKSAEKE